VVENAPLCCQEGTFTLAERRVAFLLAGPVSDLSEELTTGVRSVALDVRVVPECPPGPAARDGLGEDRHRVRRRNDHDCLRGRALREAAN
jgi:hypothetical protein